MSMTASVTELRYQDPERNSNKFYRLYLLWDEEERTYRLLCNWGRWGSRGQFKVEQFGDYGAASLAGIGKRREKESKGYRLVREERLDVVPEDLLNEACVTVSDNARSQDRRRLELDPHAKFASDADQLIRMVTGPTDLATDVFVLRASLEDQLSELRKRLTESEGRMEFISNALTARVLA